MVKLYKQDQYIYYENDEVISHQFLVAEGRVNFQYAGGGKVYITIYIEEGYTTNTVTVARVAISDIKDRFGNSYGSTLEELGLGFNKGINTNALDIFEDLIIEKFNQVHDNTTLAQNVVGPLGQTRILEVTSATGISVGSHIILFNPASVRFTTFTVIGVSGTTITTDSLIDFLYPVGTFVEIAITNMAVNGSVTPQVFGLRGTSEPPDAVDLDFHYNRTIFFCLTESAISLAEFADIPALTRGLMARSRNNRFHNIWNVKTNVELAGILYDWDPHAATNPIQGQDGFIARLTYNSKSKIGGVIRLPIGTDGEVVVQDDLTAITLLEIMAEGPIWPKYLKP